MQTKIYGRSNYVCAHPTVVHLQEFRARESNRRYDLQRQRWFTVTASKQ